MKKPTGKVLEFLENHRISVVGISQTDGTIHSATLHFSFDAKAFTFYFSTNKNSRKCESLLKGGEQSASLVIGFDEEEKATFQAKGVAKIVSKNAERGWKTHATKFPEKEKSKDNEKVALIQFAPHWWRFTDLKTKPWTKISSDDY